MVWQWPCELVAQWARRLARDIEELIRSAGKLARLFRNSDELLTAIRRVFDQITFSHGSLPSHSSMPSGPLPRPCPDPFALPRESGVGPSPGGGPGGRPETDSRDPATEIPSAGTRDRFSLDNLHHPDWPVLRDGSHVDPVTGDLRPNVRYQAGEHDYIYTTDARGRIDSFHADDLQLKDHDGRQRYDSNPPGKGPNDHAGHLAGDRFGGSPHLDNIVAQLDTVNLSSYKRLENLWADAIAKGKHVSVDVHVTNDLATGRPTRFDIIWSIDGRRGTASIKNN